MEKKEFIEHLNHLIDKKIDALQNRFDDLNNDLASDHKSSAGDKHETGRAMIQLEQEKLSSQLSQFSQQKETISKLNAETTAKVQLGSVVKTSNGTFFISIGLGKVTIDNETIFCISTSSPIGQLLLSKKKGDTIKFNGNSILLEELS